MTQSKYCYPNTNILINKLNIKDERLLERAERRLTAIRLAELYNTSITGKFDLKHLQQIHKYIFQDLYDFSGKLRDEQIAKGYFQFASPLYLKDMFNDLHRNLKQENFLKGLNKDQMADRLAYYMAEINVIHPFREGNGRSTREFIRCLAMSNGYTLDWTRVDKEQLLKASIESITNEKNLAKLLNEAIIENEPSKEVLNQWKKFEKENDEMEL